MIEKAYGLPVELNADERIRPEAEARGKALKDYNTLMGDALDEGIKIGTKRSIVIGTEREKAARKMEADCETTNRVVEQV